MIYKTPGTFAFMGSRMFATLSLCAIAAELGPGFDVVLRPLKLRVVHCLVLNALRQGRLKRREHGRLYRRGQHQEAFHLQDGLIGVHASAAWRGRARAG